MMIEEQGVKMFVFAYQPSEEDKKAIAAGKPIFFQIYKELHPFMLYTLGADGKPNIEKPEPKIEKEPKRTINLADIRGKA